MNVFRKIAILFVVVILLQGLALTNAVAQYTTEPVIVWGNRPVAWTQIYYTLPWYGSSAAHYSAQGPITRDIGNPENGPPGGWGNMVQCSYFMICDIPYAPLTCNDCGWSIPGCNENVQSTASDRLSGTVTTEVPEGAPCNRGNSQYSTLQIISHSTVRRDVYEKNGEVCGEWRHYTFTVANSTRICQ